MFADITPIEEHPNASLAWLSSSSSDGVLKGNKFLIYASLAMAVFMKSLVFITPACISIGFIGGCLAKKELRRYNCTRIFLQEMHLREGKLKKVRWIAICVVILASMIFPLLAAFAACSVGVYCGMFYTQR